MKAIQQPFAAGIFATKENIGISPFARRRDGYMSGKQMSIRGDRFKFGVLRRWAAHLLLLAFVARALVPVGYMPDFSAASKGVFKVTICSQLGSKTIFLDVNDKPAPNQQGSHHDQPCALTGMAAVALPVIDIVPFSAPVFEVSPLIPRLAVQLPPSRAGPHLGSRGPPLLS
ncbi:MAG: hypothetical protein ABL893_09320 [Hyphomicrobium sp.]